MTERAAGAPAYGAPHGDELRVGVRLEMSLDYETVSAHARLAEQLGYAHAWVRDHVSLEQTTGLRECLECWTTLAGLGRDTERIGLGSLVLCTPFRNPALLAKMGATLDELSRGRLLLGLGTGFRRSEFEEYGYDYPSRGERVRMLGEAARIVRLMWTEDRPSFDGRHYRIESALNKPKPPQRPHPPILVGARSPRALGVAARHADWWNPPQGLANYDETRALVDEACRATDREPTTLRHIVSIAALPDTDGERARVRLDATMGARGGQQALGGLIVAGTPEEVAEHVQPYLDRGVRDFIANFWEPQPEAQEQCQQLFAEEVLPLLRERARASAPDRATAGPP